ncbi:hypothetical protein EDD18DRAFT_1213940, partial [Armillaria luteobubalina]
ALQKAYFGNHALMRIGLLKSAHSIMTYRYHGMNSVEMGQSFRLWLFTFVGTSPTKCVSFKECACPFPSVPASIGYHNRILGKLGVYQCSCITSSESESCCRQISPVCDACVCLRLLVNTKSQRNKIIKFEYYIFAETDHKCAVAEQAGFLWGWQK